MLELSEAMEKYVEIIKQIKDLKEAKDELRTEMLLLIKTNDIDEYDDDNNMLKYTISKRRSFNKEEAITFIEDKGGDANAFFTESDYETLKVKSKGGNQE